MCSDDVNGDIEIYTLKDGTKIVTATIAGRPISMTSFEWRLFCHDMLIAIGGLVNDEDSMRKGINKMYKEGKLP